MNTCAEYEKYFFDFTENSLSGKKLREYEKHIAACVFCAGQAEAHLRYRKILEHFQKTQPPEEYSLRLGARIRGLRLREEESLLIDRLGFIDLESIGRLFDLPAKQLKILEESAFTVYIKGAYYIPREHAAGLILDLLRKVRPEEFDIERLARQSENLYFSDSEYDALRGMIWGGKN